MLYRVQRRWNRWKARRRFGRDFRAFQRLSAAGPARFALEWKDRFPCLEDWTATTGFDRHYVYHTAWAARVVARLRPVEHVDIASSLYFCGLVSAFVPVRFYDYRPADLRLNGLESRAGDLMRLPFADGSVPCLSCMHVVEHIGLGRYGDPLDPEGDRKACAELARVLAPGGHLLFVVPTGTPRIQYNAHRIYARAQVLELFAGLTLREFALVPDDPAAGGLIVDPPADLLERQRYGCGCYWFQRPEARDPTGTGAPPPVTSTT